MAVSPSSLPKWALPLLILFQMPSWGSAKFTVEGPDEPVVAMFGAEVELPCHLDPQMNAEHMEVRWYRDDVSNVVHHYREGKDLDEEQILDYAGRTELLKEGLTDGRVTLRLHNVLFLDDGDYVCHVQDGEFYEQAIIHLSVAALGSQLQIRMAGQEGDGIRLVCSSSGWFPEPRLRWTDHRGQERPTLAESKSRDRSGLFRTEGSLLVTDRSTSAVSCSVWNPVLDQGKVTEVSVAESFFPRVSPVLVALAVILSLLGLLLIGSAYVIWAQRREKNKLISEHRVQTDNLKGECDYLKERLALYGISY
ncbi:butyrophilin subfamily 1 member A1-like [Ornithorhynchus anatinus]|uniref:butyrophilin subfamily 1 member A1-like n=1 Tax=Ornithorhynchus anatinus TaxID=9258 RepID=UPI0010A817F2|nr:butyrophilin subfamily 1 member A1-like [Ornithorhynchus anatinus]